MLSWPAGTDRATRKDDGATTEGDKDLRSGLLMPQVCTQQSVGHTALKNTWASLAGISPTMHEAKQARLQLTAWIARPECCTDAFLLALAR